eukprot:scaffold8332_cov156-Alexandrium_tamarense.AAC.1
MNPALTSLPSHYLLSHQTLPQDRVSSVEPPQNERLEEDSYFGYHLANVLPSSLVSVYDAEEYHRLHSERSDGARRV